jgi:hypothetical protein
LEDGSWIFKWPKCKKFDPVPFTDDCTETSVSVAHNPPVEKQEKTIPGIVTPKSSTPTPEKKRQRDTTPEISHKCSIRLKLSNDDEDDA